MLIAATSNLEEFQKDQIDRRWSSLQYAMEAAYADIRDFPLPRDSRTAPYAQKALLHLLDNLRAFTGLQIAFFTDRARQDAAPKGYTNAYAIARTLRQAGIDLSVMTQAAAQRLSAALESDAVFEKADELARWSLEPSHAVFTGSSRFTGSRLIPITYFQKSIEIRVTPYASVAFIGMPYWAGDASRVDLMAIPHEIGHYVYWNAHPAGGSCIYNAMSRKLREAGFTKTELTHAAHWQEEIFADVYGARVAGPMITLSFQDLQMWLCDDDFFEDDFEHPPAFLRPYGYSRTLKHIGLDAWSTALDARWALLSRKPPRAVARAKASMQRAIEQVADIANALLDAGGFDAGLSARVAQLLPAMTKPEDAHASGLLYEAWRKLVDGMQTSPKKDLQPMDWSADAWRRWHAQLVMDDERANPEHPGSLQDREWFAALTAGGWTDAAGEQPRRIK